MLWAFRHEWPRGAQFTFNCYCHWAPLVVCNTDYGSGHFLHSNEIMDKGYLWFTTSLLFKKWPELSYLLRTTIVSQ